MTPKIPIREVVLVEGRYDKITLSSVLDATILTTDGFSIFNNAEKRALLVKMGEARGIILLTDSDGGGVQIRSYLSGVLPRGQVKHLYVPRIEGKEKRKRQASRSGVLGVEGMEAEVLRRLFEPLRADVTHERGREITKTDLFEAGLLGGENASQKRNALCERLGLPPLHAKGLLAAMNCLLSYEDFVREVGFVELPES